jgi:uncharacterized membrane protein YdjX (TVP38/TMEM64 family)
MQAPAILLDLRATRRRMVILVAIVIGIVALVFLYRWIDMPALHQRAEGINGGLVFVLITVLPLAGFPVSVAHAVAGVRFEFGPGLALVAVSIVLQLLASYALVKAMPKFFARRLDPLRRRLPKGAHAAVTQFAMLLPGVPFFAQNYVLPLVGVPLGTYLWWSIPIHVAKSAIGVVFGDMSDDLTPVRIGGFVLYVICITVACTWAFRRLQVRLKVSPAKTGRKRNARTRTPVRTR